MNTKLFYPCVFLLWTDTVEEWSTIRSNWFQWMTVEDDSPLKRISAPKTVDEAVDKIKSLQTFGLKVGIIFQSAANPLIDKLLKDPQGVKPDKVCLISAKARSPFDIIHLLCDPDEEMIALWETLCESKLEAEAKVSLLTITDNPKFQHNYCQAFEKWFANLVPIERIGRVPNRPFAADEFILQSKDHNWHFHHRWFPPAHFTLHWNNDEKRYQATGSGVFLHQMPELRLGDQTLTPEETDNKIVNRFWWAWLKHFNANGVVIPLPAGLPKPSDELSYAQQSRTGTYKSGTASSELDQKSNALDNEWRTIKQGPLTIQYGPGTDGFFRIIIKTTEPDQEWALITFLSAEGKRVGETKKVALKRRGGVLKGIWRGQQPEGSESFEVSTTP